MDYSLDQGNEWTLLKFYEAWRYSTLYSIESQVVLTYSLVLFRYTTDHFFHIELEIPEEAKSRQIRFRFTQNVFEAARDNWALDNVRVSEPYNININILLIGHNVMSFSCC